MGRLIRLHRALVAVWVLPAIITIPGRDRTTIEFLDSPALQTETRAAVPVDRFVTVNGLRIHYLDWGSPDKPPFIMLHGIGRIAHTFDHLAPRFAGGTTTSLPSTCVATATQTGIRRPGISLKTT